MGSNITTPITAGIGALVATALILSFNAYGAPYFGVPPISDALSSVVIGIGVWLGSRLLPPHTNG